MNTPAAAKKILREQMRLQVQALPPATRAAAGAMLAARFLTLPIWQRAKTVLLFAPLGDEPDIWPLLPRALADGKRVGLPAFVPQTQSYGARLIQEPTRDLRLGRFGIREPAESCPEIPLNQLDLVLVPGVAFDARGGRLGRGKGFYDRLLAGVSGTKCGVAFDEQLVATVPVEPQDISLNCILTPTRWLET